MYWVVYKRRKRYPLVSGPLKPSLQPNGSSDVYLPSYIKRTGHVVLRDTATALDHRMLKVEQTGSGSETDEMLIRSLSESTNIPILPLLMGVFLCLNDQDEVKRSVTKLYPTFENFSRSFCSEKDVMNHQFRGFVNAYIKAINNLDYKELSMTSIFISPFVLEPWYAIL